MNVFRFAIWSIYIVKGSWEAILPSYEWLLPDGIDLDDGWYIIQQYITQQYITKEQEAMELTLMKGGRSHNNT